MRAVAACLAIAILLSSSSGCRMLSGGWPFHRTPPCTFKPDATKQEIVAHVNRFSSAEGERPALSAWRSTDVSFTIKGMPPVPGTIDVEAPSRLRIRASMPLGNSAIADIGSNDELVWFWQTPSPEIVTIRHEHVPIALRNMQIPFEPEWLMEVLGVTPMNVEDFELRRSPDQLNWVDLVAHRDTPTGESVVRVIRVDLCHGQVIEHRIEANDGTLIASAKLSDYTPDVRGQFMMPHVVKIEWPLMAASLTLRMGPIHANPQSLGDTGWQVPRLSGLARREFVPPEGSQNRFADPRGIRTEPLRRDALVEPGTRMDVSPDAQSATGQPAAYFQAASQSSSDPLPLEQESGPRPFPPQP